MVTTFDCPQCGKSCKGGTFVLGHHYCSECDIRFNDDGKVIGEGRA
jgi:hypothetical protein